ncbi:hypothetical protein FF38_00904 [Lucilia cuprina]|uniref:Uncharacterized protein n=1 Tax=Lucilia cuprina TaxID=7375 RepID=A0A0L0C4C1_LUCCU|nr:hypothetical protein FF38_00904 [Lucilia cuprina]
MKRCSEEAYRKSQPSHLSCSSGVSNVKRPCSKQKFVYNRPKPDTLQSILRSKANPEYNSRRLWYELNMPECTSEILDGRMLSTSIPDRLLCHTKEMRCKRRIQTKKKEMGGKKLDVPLSCILWLQFVTHDYTLMAIHVICFMHNAVPLQQHFLQPNSLKLLAPFNINKIERPSYMQMRLERENFRKKLVELIARKDDDDDVVNATAGGSPANAIDLEAEFPNKEEKEVLRYYYYIKHGIDTIHVSPMSKKVLNRIKSQIPAVLNKWATALNENIVEIKSDYVFAMKKAVIDFVLQNSLINLKKDAQLELTAERKEANRMFNRWRYRSTEARSFLSVSGKRRPRKVVCIPFTKFQVHAHAELAAHALYWLFAYEAIAWSTLLLLTRSSRLHSKDRPVVFFWQL